MKNKFDELFNEFFENSNNNDNQPIPNEFDNVVDAFKNVKTFDESEFNDIEFQLGDPTIIEEIVEDGMKFIKYSWITEQGTFYKIILEKDKPLSIQEQLDEALEKEDYELACKLRDKMNKKKK